MSVQQVYIGGRWQQSAGTETFHAYNPRTGEPLEDQYPLSSWEDCEQALHYAQRAAQLLRERPDAARAEFLERYAARIEARKNDLVEMAHLETALPKSPRLADGELPRTIDQLRQAAAAAREGSWALPTIDAKNNIRSRFVALGPVCVFGPNNFPFAFGSASGGDFAAAIAAGNPVIAKAHSSHPGTTRIFAEEAVAAVAESDLPASTVQLLYRIRHADGQRLVSDQRVGSTGYTGSRDAGLQLKAAADAAGKTIYVELSSINPVVVLPGAMREKLADIADQFTASCLMGSGQFCTNPGLVLLLASEATDEFAKRIAGRFMQSPAGPLLSRGVAETLRENVGRIVKAGAKVLTGNEHSKGAGYGFANTLLRVDGATYLERPLEFQTEAFGNASLLVVAADLKQAIQILNTLEGNLTGTIYSHSTGEDDEAYNQLVPHLRSRVGRLLNDKMPTGVAVSPAMNHGGPFPATGHPGFTAVGIPAALRRFAMLECYDGVRPERLPATLQDKNPDRKMWRCIDGRWTQDDVPRK